MYRIICRKHGNAMGLVMAMTFATQEAAERRVAFWASLFPYQYTIISEADVVLPV